jgi:hypothetical protein
MLALGTSTPDDRMYKPLLRGGSACKFDFAVQMQQQPLQDPQNPKHFETALKSHFLMDSIYEHRFF